MGFSYIYISDLGRIAIQLSFQKRIKAIIRINTTITNTKITKIENNFDIFISISSNIDNSKLNAITKKKADNNERETIKSNSNIICPIIWIRNAPFTILKWNSWIR